MDTEQPYKRMSPVLNWLVQKRARADGHVNHLNQAIADLHEQLKAAITVRAEMDQAIKHYSKDVDVTSIRPIRPTKERQNYGARANAIRNVLNRHPGVWLSTTAIVLECAEIFQVNLNNRSYAFEFKWKIEKELRRQAQKGEIHRNHELQTNEEGFWALIVPLSNRAQKIKGAWPHY